MTKLHHITLASCLIALTSCTPTAGIEDGENDTFLDDGKADGISEGSAEARAVLAFVNSASVNTLVNKAELSQAVATNIFAHRVGDDEEEGTSDDDQYDTLAELDAVPLVGLAVFTALREHAGGACTGGGARATTVDLGTMFLSATGRFCQPWGRVDGGALVSVTQNMHFLPGSVRHGSYLVIALEQTPPGWLNPPVKIEKQAFEAYWGATLPASASYRRANLSFCGDPSTGEGDGMQLRKFDELGVPSSVAAAPVAAGECRSFSSATGAGVRRPASPGSATPGVGTPAAGGTKPFITEICHTDSDHHGVTRGYSFVEIYVP